MILSCFAMHSHSGLDRWSKSDPGTRLEVKAMVLPDEQDTRRMIEGEADVGLLTIDATSKR